MKETVELRYDYYTVEIQQLIHRIHRHSYPEMLHSHQNIQKVVALKTKTNLMTLR